MKVTDRQRGRQTSFLQRKEEKCKDWVVKWDKTKTGLKIGSIIILSQKNPQKI